MDNQTPAAPEIMLAQRQDGPSASASAAAIAFAELVQLKLEELKDPTHCCFPVLNYYEPEKNIHAPSLPYIVELYALVVAAFSTKTPANWVVQLINEGPRKLKDISGLAEEPFSILTYIDELYALGIACIEAQTTTDDVVEHVDEMRSFPRALQKRSGGPRRSRRCRRVPRCPALRRPSSAIRLLAPPSSATDQILTSRDEKMEANFELMVRQLEILEINGKNLEKEWNEWNEKEHGWNLLKELEVLGLLTDYVMELPEQGE